MTLAASTSEAAFAQAGALLRVAFAKKGGNRECFSRCFGFGSFFFFLNQPLKSESYLINGVFEDSEAFLELSM